MVSLDLPEGALDMIPDGVADHHITVVFLGRDVDDATFDAVCARAEAVAERMRPPAGAVEGLDSFPPSDSSDGKVPVFAVPDVPAAHDLRAAFEDFNASEHKDYKPHVTLTYLDPGESLPKPVPRTPVTFTHLSVHRGGEVRHFPFAGVSKAERTRVPEGITINVQPALSVRARVLSDQLDQEVKAALGELAEHAATAYASVAEKSVATYLHRIAGKVMRALNLQAWIHDRLMPILRNHAGRVVGDTRRTLQTEIGLEMHVAEEQVQAIAEQAGQRLGMRDIEPQVRAAILTAVRQGMAAGEGPSKTAQRIKDLVPAGRFVHAGPGYRARLIAREETARAQRAATEALYKSNPNITHVELRDGIFGPPRSDGECIARDGEIVPIDEIDTVHPYHVQCTLSLSPVVHASLPAAA